jgi:hypothetical protein
MALKETGKQRAQRIPLDYYRDPDPVRRWKAILGWSALIVPLAWLGFGVRNPEQHFHGSRGQVAKVHQAINDQCSACHTPFQAISSDSWTVPILTHAADVNSQKCQTCHEGPAHHTGQKPDLSCASCHREHRGVEASLTHLADNACLNCHKDLPAHHENGILSLAADALAITRFAKDSHPAFRSTKADPGKLHFNHKLHLAPGIALDDGTRKGGPIQFLRTIPEPYRERYMAMQGAKNIEEAVRLDCASCHVLDAGDFAKTGLPEARQHSDGAYFLPITYENHCQGCHALEALSVKGEAAKITVPHRLQAPALKKFLENTFLAEAARGDIGFLERKLVRPLPGKKLQPLVEDEKVRTQVQTQLGNAAKLMLRETSRNSCMECHELQGSLPEDPWLAKIAPTNVPQVWFKGARFDHKAHRAFDCQSCHDRAATSEKNTDVLIATMDNCVQCHAPRGTDAAGKASGGVDAHCTTCHVYHHRQEPFAGLGSRARAPRHPGSFADFLNGKGRNKE